MAGLNGQHQAKVTKDAFSSTGAKGEERKLKVLPCWVWV